MDLHKITAPITPVHTNDELIVLKFINNNSAVAAGGLEGALVTHNFLELKF